MQLLEAPGPHPRTERRRRKLVRRLSRDGAERDHLARTVGALLLNTAATSALGVAYWVIVARLYSPTNLARNSALIAAMLTISGICQLNMGLGLGALLPRAGRLAGRMLAEVYLLVTLVTVGVLAVFLLLVLPQIPSLNVILVGSVTVAVFIGAVLFYNVFALEDAALAALRAPEIVPLENAIFGVAKIVVVVVLATILPRTGIFLSWATPLLFIVLPISTYVFTRVAPRQRHAPVGHVRLVDAARPVALDYVSYLFLACSTLALPAIALALVGPQRAAVFSVAYLTSSSLDLFGANIGVALTVEASHAREKSAEIVHRTLTRGLPLLALLSAVGVLVAPVILSFYGPRYAASGVPLTSTAHCRSCAARRVGTRDESGTSGAAHGIYCAHTVSDMLPRHRRRGDTSPVLGLTGIGLAWVGAQTIVCLTVLPSLLRSQRS